MNVSSTNRVCCASLFKDGVLATDCNEGACSKLLLRPVHRHLRRRMLRTHFLCPV